jgi:hypothetical protein
MKGAGFQTWTIVAESTSCPPAATKRKSANPEKTTEQSPQPRATSFPLDQDTILALGQKAA